MTRLIPPTNLSDELRDIIVKHTSAMLDNHDKYGIYPTTKFYDDLVAAITTAYAEAIREARIDELNYCKKYMISTSPFISEIIEPRLAALSAEKPQEKE